MITYTSSDPLIVLLMLFYSNYVMRNKTVSIVSALTCSFKPVDTLCLLYPLCIIIIYMPCWFLLLNCLFHRISNLIANSYNLKQTCDWNIIKFSHSSWIVVSNCVMTSSIGPTCWTKSFNLYLYGCMYSSIPIRYIILRYTQNQSNYLTDG